MWWWGPCAGASCCSDVVVNCIEPHGKAAKYVDLQPLAVPERLSTVSSRSAASSTRVPCGLYSALYVQTQERVALKVLAKRILKRQETRRRLRQEIRVLAHCRGHPHLLALYDVFSTSTTLEIAFELAQGGEAMHRIRTPPPASCIYRFSEREMSRVIASVVSGLRFLHEREIIHGEIRPEHVLYSDLEPDARVLIVAFGRSTRWRSTPSGVSSCRSHKADQNNNSMSMLCHPNRVRGAQDYLWNDLHDCKFLPPFVLARQNEHAVRNWREARQMDIWALGVTMYVLLCGAFPFPGDTVEEIHASVLHGPLTFPDDGAAISLGAHDLLKRLLEKNPDEAITIEQVSAHPWIQDQVASDLSWSTDIIEHHRAFAAQYAEEVTASSSARRAAASAARPSLRYSGGLDVMDESDGGAYVDYEITDLMNDCTYEPLSDDEEERPSYISTGGNAWQALDPGDLPPTSDGYMRMASAEIEAALDNQIGSDCDATDDSNQSEGRRQPPQQPQQEQQEEQSLRETNRRQRSSEKKLWHAFLRNRRFMSMRSISTPLTDKAE